MSQPDLRTRLKALVEELHQQAAIYRRGQELSDERQALAYTQCARKLAALLAESEPGKCLGIPVDGPDCSVVLRHCPDCGMRREAPKPTPERSGCGRDHGGGSWNANCPDCEAKAKLPLGHEFVEWTEPLMSGEVRPMGSSHCKLCGRKRDAHGGLPLGHAFVSCDCLPRFKECQLFVKDDRCHEGFSEFCGQPRSAHEVKP